MKTNLILAALTLGLLAMSPGVLAQIPYVGALQYGVKAGINTAWVTGEETQGVEESPRLGIAAGIAARYWLSPSLSLQAEAQYSQKGEKADFEGTDVTVQLDYIEIPVLARYAIPLSPLMTAGVFAGPSVGIPISSKLNIEGETGEIEDVSTDFGLNVGADIGSGPFYVDGRYNFGLTDVFDDTEGTNQSVQFTFGYWF